MKRYFDLNRISQQLKARKFHLFIVSYVVCLVLIYQYKYQLKGFYEPREKSLLISAVISIFPAMFLVPIVGFLREQSAANWLESMVDLAILVASADGEFTDKELGLIKKSLEKQLTGRNKRKAIGYLESINTISNVNLNTSCKQIKTAFHPYEITVFMDMLIQITLSNKFLTIKEEDLIMKIAERIGVSASKIDVLLNRRSFVSEKNRNNNHHKKERQSTQRTVVNNLYKTLGIKSESSWEEVKKAYRELVKIYHPDKIKDKNLRESATIQFHAINEAYEKIKKDRNK